MNNKIMMSSQRKKESEKNRPPKKGAKTPKNGTSLNQPQNFDESAAELMSTTDLLNLTVQHLRRHEPQNTEEADKYREFLTEKILKDEKKNEEIINDYKHIIATKEVQLDSQKKKIINLERSLEETGKSSSQKSSRCQEHSEQIKKLKEEKKELQKQLKDCVQEIENLKMKLQEDNLTDLQNQREEIKVLTEENKALQQNHEIIKKVNTTLKEELQQLKDTLQKETIDTELSSQEKVKLQEYERKYEALEQEYKNLMETLNKQNTELEHINTLNRDLQEDLKKEKVLKRNLTEDMKKENPVLKEYLKVIECQQTNLLKSTLEKIEDLFHQKMTDESIIHPLKDTPTYAQKLSGPAKPQKELHTLIISPSDGMTIPEIRDNLNSIPTTDIKIRKCVTSKSGKLIVRCENESSIQSLEEKLSNNDHIKEKVEVLRKEPRGDKIIIFSIPAEVSQSELEMIIRQSCSYLKIIKFHQTNSRDRIYHQVIELDSLTAKQLLKQGRLLVRFNSCPLRKHISLPRCFHCQRYGHIAASCSNAAKREKTINNLCCEFCASTHNSDTCPVKDEPDKHKCINCINDNEKYKESHDINHPTSSRACPTYLIYLRDQRYKNQRKYQVR